MTRLVKWGAMRINRRRALTAAGVGVFATLASVAVASPAHAGPCSGPYGTGWCGSALCSGPNCRNALPYKCSKIYGHCGATPCWSSSGHTCCDCRCTDGPVAWYCYCHG